MKLNYTIFVIAFLCSACSMKQTDDGIIPIKKDSIKENIRIEEKQDKISTNNSSTLCDIFSMDTLNKYYPTDKNSGRSNKPTLINDCYFKKDAYYGFYSMYDNSSNLEPPVIAKAIVAFEKLPWLESDRNQDVLVLFVQDKLFKCDPFIFEVSDSIRIVDEVHDRQSVLGDIFYYKIEDCMLAIKVQNEVIDKYLIWTCKSSEIDLNEKHPLVERYLR